MTATGAAIRRHLGDLVSQIQQDNGMDELVRHRFEEIPPDRFVDRGRVKGSGTRGRDSE